MGCTSKTNLFPVVKLQKRILRIISSAPFRAHSSPLFAKYRILSIDQIYKYSILIFMYKFHNKTLPNIFDRMFCKNQDIHCYLTRQYYKLHVPKFNITAYKHSVKYMGVSLWNRICDKLDKKCSFFTFKFRLKEYLLFNEIVI